ncbi:MAG: hypothetical protein ACREX8_01300 [Gammaproteobacteria bacterium]
MTRKVRTTMQPGVELEVSDTEYTDLARQGLLVSDDTTTQADTTQATEQSLGTQPRKAKEDS